MSVSRKRHLLKAITYRVGGSVITACIGLALTGSMRIGGLIGLADFVFKIVLYYLHERLWYRIVGSMITACVGLALTGSMRMGGLIGLADFVFKIVDCDIYSYCTTSMKGYGTTSFIGA